MAEPLNATFFAFKKREKGGLLLGASVAFAIAMIVLFVGWAILVGLAMGSGAMFLNPKIAADPQAAAAMVTPGHIFTILGSELVLFFLIFVLLASYEAACLRWMIRGEKGGLFGLSLNADTWRVYGGYWLWFVLALVGYFVFFILVFAISALNGMLGDAPVAVRIVAGVVSAVVCLCLPFYLLVRTAPASAVSVGTRRFAFFDSWKVTKGRFWALFGSYFLLWLVYIIIICVIWSIMFGSTLLPVLQQVAANPGDQQGNALRINQAMMAMFSNPQSMAIYWGSQIVGLVVALMFYVLNYGVGARAVIAAAEEGKIDGVEGVTVANTFS